MRFEIRELAPGEAAAAAAALLALRPHFGDAEAVARRAEEQRAEGYRLAAVFESGTADAPAAAGFRIARNLAWGRHLYVDDLVTAASRRGRGHADRLFAWLEDEARNCGCTQFHLDSGLGEDRQDAHRFYFRHGLRIASFHFAREL
jgi:GNAT superfamily N-acetyltransferase